MFETHKLTEKGFDDVRTLKTELNNSVKKVLALMPDGRDKAIFCTKIEEAAFFGTRALAAKEGNFSEIIKYE